MERQGTEAANDLPDAVEFLTVVCANVLSRRLEPIINQVLGAATREGYRLYYDASPGIQMHTSGGAWAWFYPAHSQDGLAV